MLTIWGAEPADGGLQMHFCDLETRIEKLEPEDRDWEIELLVALIRGEE